MNPYVQYGHETEAERAEQRRQRELDGWLKELEQMQALIVIKLRLALRSGMTRNLSDELDEAGKGYLYAFRRIVAACPIIDEPQRIKGKR